MFFDYNLYLRILSAGVLIPVILFILLTGGKLLTFMIIVMSVLMCFEWAKVTHCAPTKWQTLGVLYLGLALYSMLEVAEDNHLFLKIMTSVWAVDIGAYLAGKSLGGPKICSYISPKKTWAGLIGGVIACYFFAQYFFHQDLYYAIAIAIISQSGDFFESWVKRCNHVKDSGNFIPGHGGILDRMDGVIAVMIFANLVGGF